LTTGPRPESAPDGAERALVARARAGSAEAFEALYRREAGRVYGLALRLTGDRARATELTQDVFVRAWERLATFRGEAPVSAWLRRITVTALLEGARTDRRRLARVALAGDEIVDAAPAPTRRDVEAGIDLERAVAALPPAARTVFVLHDVEGYRHEEIARMTGTAAGTCRAHLHRARRLLMEALGR
jgi:RNA polymerase sigma-70 factor (ECF subfamily)